MDYRNKNILITGGTGSWGNELTKQLIKLNPKSIIILSRNEDKQVEMQRRFNLSTDFLKFRLGDVKNYNNINDVVNGIDIVFHLAAIKHVPIAENQPYEVIETIVRGTENVIRASINNNVERVINVSSDKAVDPINTYGYCKALGEKLILQANNRGNTKFVGVRAGNVMGSNGSVIPFFIKKIKEGSDVTITHSEMTRYFMTLEEAIGLLLDASKQGIGGEVFILKMPSCKIVDLAKVLIDYYGNEKTNMVEVGLRPGEKLHEVLTSKHEDVFIHDKYYIVCSDLMPKDIKAIYLKEDLFKEQYSSNDKLMNTDEIRKMLKEGGFLE